MDRERILSKIAELDSYQLEIKEILPGSYEEYTSSIETKRACERLIHIMIETVIDISTIIVKELKLGLPGEEDDVFKKLHKKGVITKSMKEKLKRMKGFRNILVHRYAEVDDELVFSFLKEDIRDFNQFRKEVVGFLKKLKKP